MNPNELRGREAREWLEKALDDLESARVLAATDHAANALYHCQQSMIALAASVLAEVQSRLPGK